MKTTISSFTLCKGIGSFHLKGHLRIRGILVSIIFLGILFHTSQSSAQSIAKLTNVGTNEANTHNSVSDDQGNIYYCTHEINTNSLNVTCISKVLLVQWSYNYNIAGTNPVAGINYLNGKLYITTSTNDNKNLIVLVIDLLGNVIFSKQIATDFPTFASTVMHNNDLIITTGYNEAANAITITRLTPSFTTVFNKQIQFQDRSFVYIGGVKQFGNRIYFGGAARIKGEIGGYWVFGALEMNGALAFLHEYKLDGNDPYPNTHFAAMDSVSSNVIIASGYYNELQSNELPYTSDGILVKFNSLDGSVIDHLVLSPPRDQDYLFFLGVKYQTNSKIRISGLNGIDHDFNNTGLLFGEVDLDFRNYQFKASNTLSSNTVLAKFTDYDHVIGRLSGEPILLAGPGMGTCKSNNECLVNTDLVTLNKAFIPVPNNYALIDINYVINDLIVQKKPIPVALTANCGVMVCEDSHVIQICKEHYVYDYSAIHQNPGPVNNLTPTIADFTLDRINRKIIIDPLKSGTAIILMETQMNIFLKQLDTFKFLILNDSLPVLDLGPDKVLCNGDSVVLSFGLDSIHWSDGSIRKAITVKKAGLYWGSYSNGCGAVADTIVVTMQTAPKLNLGNDLLLCGNQSGTLSSNYDNTIWSNGGMGRNIVVNTAGKIVGFVSTPCGVSFDTIEVFKFDKNSFSAGTDQQSCDSVFQLNASFVNPNAKLYSSTIEWKQIDQLPQVTFDNKSILNPTISNLTKDKFHFFELNIKLDNSCNLKDTIRILSKNCLLDSCAFTIQKNCLANGMVELKALDNNNQMIIPKTRKRELFWDIKDGPAGRGYSVTDKNPVIVSNHTKYCITSKIYSWRTGYPHTIEYADICKREICDSLTLNCSGPCEDFSFILSSCLDDYDVENNLNYPPQFCKSVCDNSCDYIVGIFDLNGNMIDKSFYEIKWSTGETGAISMQKGCFNYVLTVEVKDGDCIWYGRYRPSCKHHNGFTGDHNEMKRSGPASIDIQSLKIMLNEKREFSIYNLNGQFVGKDEIVMNQLNPGVYFIESKQDNRTIVRKMFISSSVQ